MTRLLTGFSRALLWIAAAALATPVAAQQTLWAKSVKGPAGGLAYLGDGRFVTRALAADRFANVIVTGAASNGTQTDFVTTKLAASNGGVIWQATLAGTAGKDDDPVALAVDSSGNVLVLGHSYDANGNTDVKLLKYAAADGALQWMATWDGGASTRRAITTS